MKKSLVYIIIGIVLIIGITIGISFYYIYGRTYVLHLPQFENLKSISLEKNEKEEIINDGAEIKNILGILKEKRKTRQESNQDYPTNADDIIKIKFDLKEYDSPSILFAYKRNTRYFIEQPYNGIYEINKDEYKVVEKYVR